MASVTITIPDGNLADVRDTLCVRWGAVPTVITNPEKVAFLKARVARFILDEYSIAKSESAVAVQVEDVRQTAFDQAQTVAIS